MNTQSLRFRLGLWYAVLLSAVFVLLGAATIVVLKHYLEGNVRETQLRRAHQIAQVLRPAIIRQGPATLEQEVESRFAPGQNNRFVRIQAADRTVLYQSSSPQDRSFQVENVPLLPWPAQVESSHKLNLPEGISLLVASYKTQTPDQQWWLVEAGAPLDGVEAVLRHVALVMALTLLAAVGVAVTGGYFLVGSALSVVDRISRSAENIRLHNLSERLPIASTGDEIQRLSVALNGMIQRLDEAFQYSKRFVADASHELRTPLTVLRGELEALTERGRLSSTVQERMGSLLEEVDRLTKIVEGLLTLSRLDAGEAQGEWVIVNLTELTQVTTDQMGLLAEDKKIAVRCVTSAPAWVHGDRTRLKQVIVNLLDNAIKYTPAGGTVTWQVKAENDSAVLEVGDTGMGIPPAALPHVFERFFRADKARNRDIGGAGLGLAIVQSICTAHGGRAAVQSVEGQGSQFRIQLPLVPAPAGGDPAPPAAMKQNSSYATNTENQMARVR